MALLTALLTLQAAAGIAAGVYLFRRQEKLEAEIERLRGELAMSQAAAVAPRRRARRGEGGSVVPLPLGSDQITPVASTPMARAAQAWRQTAEAADIAFNTPTLSPETGRALVLALMAALPAAGFVFGAEASAIVAAGLTIGAAMMLIALRPIWRAAAWAGTMTAACWALIGLAPLGGGQPALADPISYAIALALAGIAGLAHAHLRRAAPGAAMAVAMSAATLALGGMIGMASPAGLGFAAIVAAAAVIGALSLRLESIHLAAFGAALLGLFVLSGQPSAAIWFTPAAAWTGALFLGVAAVRVPQLGARGVAIAGTGALTPLTALAGLYDAQHGLADPYAAAGAFLALAILLGAIIAAAATRRERGLEGLNLTLWVLMFGAFTALCAAIVLALPAPLAGPAFASTALGAAALNLRWRNGVWPALACIAAASAGFCAAASAQAVLAETLAWPHYAIIAAGLLAPAAAIAAAAKAAHRAETRASAALLEALTIALLVGAALLAVRVALSGGATLLHPISFVEAGTYCATALFLALAIGGRSRRGAVAVRSLATGLLSFGAFCGMALAVGLWLTGYWRARQAPADALLTSDTLGFVLPALLFFAHWVFWRGRSELQTRLSFGASAMLLAAYATVETLRMEDAPHWAGAVVGALALALAVGANFAPGVALPTGGALLVKARGRSPVRRARRAAR